MRPVRLGFKLGELKRGFAPLIKISSPSQGEGDKGDGAT